MKQLKIVGVEIFLEKRKNRVYVGLLEKGDDNFRFTYDERYFRAKNALALGPEFPLTQRSFDSNRLFPTFEDRIPSQQNPAYKEYCHVMGIDPEEQNPLVLLSSIGRKGPSSFIFYPKFERLFSEKSLIAYRLALGLTTRDFAALFEISQSSLNALERNRVSGKDLTKRLEVIMRFPAVAMYYLLINGGILNREKFDHVERILKAL